MRNSPSNTPYKTLGLRLKRLRSKHNRTLTEVCGAVEIDEELLDRIEAGEERPGEELLEQLINHYQMEDTDALRLWSLAGYDTDDLLVEDIDPLVAQAAPASIIMLLALEQRTLYSDSLDVHYDASGLVLNFKQVAGQKQPISVAKLGMSYEQAEKVHQTLQKVLLRHKYLKGPKALPKGKS
ncbi:MAG TPA: helix-turn-helix transcriptional regulator [Candidatus Saccharimonadales bacterium]